MRDKGRCIVSVGALNKEAHFIIYFLLYSLVLLVIEAGIDIDLSTLRLIGTRGCLIAFFGSVLPIGLGMLITWVLGMTDTKEVRKLQVNCTYLQHASNRTCFSSFRLLLQALSLAQLPRESLSTF